MSSLRAGPWAHRASLVASGLSAFSPRETNPEIWLDAELTTGLSDGDPVGTVPDLSGHGRNFTPNGSAPLWVAGGADGPAFLFDGIDDSLQWYATGLTLTPPFTVLAVARNIQGTDDGAEHTIFDLTSGGNEYALRAFFTYGPGPWFAHYGPVGTGSLVSTVPATDTTWRTWVVEAGELGSLRTQGRFDAAYQPTGYGGKPFNSGAVNVGSRVAAQRPWKGYIRAILFWNRALSATERYNLERYYATKIGLVVTPHVPTDVTGLRVWACGDSLDGMVLDAPVNQWPDLSGHGNHFLAQLNPDRRGHYTRGLHNLSGVHFGDAFIQFMYSPAGTFVGGEHSVTLASVVSDPRAATDYAPTIHGPPMAVLSAEVQAVFHEIHGSFDWLLLTAHSDLDGYPTRAAAVVPTHVNWPADTLHALLGVVTFNAPAPNRLYRNGVLLDGSRDGGSVMQRGALSANGYVHVGGEFWGFFHQFQGDVHDVLAVDHAVTDLERLILDDYLLRRILL